MCARAAILVFARAPLAGRAKTRLVRALGRTGAARLAAQLLTRALACARAARLGPVELRCAPHARMAVFRRLAQRHRVRLRGQGGGDLGARLYRGFCDALTRARAAIAIGSDCPELTPRDLRAAAQALAAGAGAALAPAVDGGYVLLALARAPRAVFTNIGWGGASVCVQTERALVGTGLAPVRLRTLADVDRPSDLPRLRRRAPALRARRT